MIWSITEPDHKIKSVSTTIVIHRFRLLHDLFSSNIML